MTALPACPSLQIATTRKLTVHLRPPATCDLEISLQGIKLTLTVNEYSQEEEVRVCPGEEARGPLEGEGGPTSCSCSLGSTCLPAHLLRGKS